MSRDWEQVGRTLQELVTRCHELGGRAESAWGKLPGKELAQTLHTTEALERLSCDALMRALIRGDGIGQPTSRQGYFCSMRCLCALDTLGIIHAELDGRALYPEPPDGWSDAQLLEWLLISNWAQRHDSWLKQSAFVVSNGLGFYSG